MLRKQRDRCCADKPQRQDKRGKGRGEAGGALGPEVAPHPSAAPSGALQAVVHNRQGAHYR